MANKILIRALGQDGTKSEPFTIFKTVEDKLPTRFVLRVDDDVDQNGEETLKISNININLIVSHRREYGNEKLKGFRRKQDDDVFIICEQVTEKVPEIKALLTTEPF